MHFFPLCCLAGLLAGLSNLHAAGSPRHVATIAQPQHGAEWRRRHLELNELSKNKETRIAFVGDSITAMWISDRAGKPAWRRYWQPLKAANFGVSGDRTENVLWRLQHGNLDGLRPKVIVLLIGTNNSGQNFTPGTYRCSARQTADGIQAILARLKQKCPGAKIILMAIFPRGGKRSDPAWRQNVATNALIKPMADSRTVFYLDIGGRFLKANGDVDVALMPDLLHLSGKGYRIWADALWPVVGRLGMTR